MEPEFLVQFAPAPRARHCERREDAWRQSNFALRLQPSLLEEARRVAEQEGVALKQSISGALAEEALGTARGGLLPRAGGAAGRGARRILAGAGEDASPRAGEEIER